VGKDTSPSCPLFPLDNLPKQCIVIDIMSYDKQMVREINRRIRKGERVFIQACPFRKRVLQAYETLQGGVIVKTDNARYDGGKNRRFEDESGVAIVPLTKKKT
jgi:hypothetical protein